MKKIKVKFIGFAQDFDPYNNLIVNSLRNHFDVVFDNNPDFLFTSLFGTPYEYVKYDCVRIFVSGENYSPDFTSVDYAIGFDNLTYQDRFLRFPIYYFDKEAENLEEKKLTEEKEYFCSFVFGHQSANGIREELLYKLNEYKRVESAGRFENNMPNNSICDTYEKKKELLRKSKFNICAESTDLDGFVTEKLLHALSCNTIPIYFGSKSASEDFNFEAYIDLRDFDSIDDLVKYVKKVDQDDELYNVYLSKQKYAVKNQYEKHLKELDAFLFNICNQDPKEAYRRPRYFYPRAHDKHLLLVNYIYKRNPEKVFHFFNKVRNVFKGNSHE